VERFFIEKIRVNTKIHVLGFQFTQAELISFLLVISGLALWFYLRKRNTIVAS
jgi:prolipoprotein diacylglyceryltransferase